MSLNSLMRKLLSAAADVAAGSGLKRDLGPMVDSCSIPWNQGWGTPLEVYCAVADNDARLIFGVRHRYEAYMLIDTGAYAGTMAEATMINWRRLLGEERRRGSN